MRTQLIRVVATLAAALLAPAGLGAQQANRLQLEPGSRVFVDGTSNKNDWTVTAQELTGWVELAAGSDALAVSGGGLRVSARRLVSEHGVIMDRLMQNALKSGTHPEIGYELDSAAVSAAGPGRYAIVARGRLTLAGVTREIEVNALGERLADGRLRFTGSHPLLMSEYGMTPPVAMFGALRTGNRVVVRFDLLVKP